MSNYSKDDLNEFFKRKLNDETVDSNQWNVPPDFVFDNAINQIERKNATNNNSKRWIILLISLLLFSLFMLTRNLINTKMLKERVAFLESQIAAPIIPEVEVHDAANAQTEWKGYPLMTEENIDIKANSVSSDFEDVNIQDRLQASFNTKQLQLKLQEMGISKIEGMHVKKNNVNTELIENSNEIFESSLTFNESFQKPESPEFRTVLNAISDVDKLEFLLPLVERMKITYTPNFSALRNDYEESENSESITYGIQLKNSFSSLSMTNVPVSLDNKLTNYDNTYHGYGIGVQGEKSISQNVSMQFGLAFQKINNQSQLEQVHLYHKNNEVEVPSGLMNYSMDVDIDTPLGSTIARANFPVDASYTQENDEINQITKTDQNFNILGVSIGPKYSFYNDGRWDIFLNGALEFNQILNYSNEMITSLKMDDVIMINFDSEPLELKYINTSYMSLRVGFGLGYSINDNLGFAVSANYVQSISSLRIAQSQADQMTYLRQWNSQIGLNYSF